MTLRAAIQLAGVEPAVVSRWLDSGTLPFREDHGKVYVERDDVVAVMVAKGLARRPEDG